MKVLFCYLTNAYRGGTKFQLDFARQFEKLEVGFATSNRDLSYKDEVLAIGPIHCLPPSKKFFQRLNMLKKLAKEYDVIYLNKATLHLPEMLLISLAGFKHIVFHSHAVKKEADNAIMQAAFHLLHFFARPFAGIIADKLYSCSVPAAQWLYGTRNASNAKVIPNAIDLRQYQFDPALRIKKRKELNVNGFCVFHAGNLTAVKNQKYLVDAFSVFHHKNPDSVLVIAGQGELYETLCSYTKEKKLMDCVRFLGQRSDIPELLQMADLFVLPSLNEGLPFSVIEAQAAGVPCIITSTSAPQAKVLESFVRFDVSKTAEELANQMQELMNCPRENTYETMQKAGFDLKTCAQELENELLMLENS